MVEYDAVLTVKGRVMAAEVPTTLEELQELAREFGRDAWLELLSRAQREKRAIKYTHTA
jgi:hypothetical protein